MLSKMQPSSPPTIINVPRCAFSERASCEQTGVYLLTASGPDAPATAVAVASGESELTLRVCRICYASTFAALQEAGIVKSSTPEVSAEVRAYEQTIDYTFEFVIADEPPTTA